MHKGKTSQFGLQSESILQKLYHAVLDEQKRYEAIPNQFTTSKEELQEGPAPINAFYVKSIEMLNEIGKTHSSLSDEEACLCRKLVKYNKFNFKIDFDKDDNHIRLQINKPVRQFIDKYYENILTIKKQYLKETPDSNVFDSLNLSREQKTELESFRKYLEDGAIKYPRLIHLVLEWPLFSRMPKPPKGMPDYDQQEYEWMLKRQNWPYMRFSSFSTLETQSTDWLIYPKGESWNKYSGVKRFQDLSCDLCRLLTCDWLKLLYEHCKRIDQLHIYDDGWDGLFDEDYDFQENGWKRGLYKCYYIPDVFYESIRLCRELLNHNNNISKIQYEQPVNTDKTGGGGKMPKAFISYSHDSDEHKKWVLDFASKLRENGVDVVLDQWDLKLGGDVAKFMESSANADRVLMICTQNYVEKADKGKGGVGYEAMIVTGELMRNLETTKFIPVIRQESGETKVPKFVSTRAYINLNNDHSFKQGFDHLLRDLHQTPAIGKPPLGKNPFVMKSAESNLQQGKEMIDQLTKETLLDKISNKAKIGDISSDNAEKLSGMVKIAYLTDLKEFFKKQNGIPVDIKQSLVNSGIYMITQMGTKVDSLGNGVTIYRLTSHGEMLYNIANDISPIKK